MKKFNIANLPSLFDFDNRQDMQEFPGNIVEAFEARCEYAAKKLADSFPKEGMPLYYMVDAYYNEGFTAHHEIEAYSIDEAGNIVKKLPIADADCIEIVCVYIPEWRII